MQMPQQSARIKAWLGFILIKQGKIKAFLAKILQQRNSVQVVQIDSRQDKV